MCKLCQETRELQDSHLIPKAVYKRLRSSLANNPNPLLIKAGTAYQTSNQTKVHLLCSACEQILSTRGERETIPLLSGEDRSSPLYDLLVEQRPYEVYGDTTVYAARANSKVPVEALAHFGLGIFWKAAVHSWHARDGDLQINLGPYEKKLREFLLNPEISVFPNGFALTVIVLPPPRIPTLLSIPVKTRSEEGYKNFRFYVPGIQFILAVGKLAPIETCLIRNKQEPIFVSNIEDQVNAIPKRMYLRGKPSSSR